MRLACHYRVLSHPRLALSWTSVSVDVLAFRFSLSCAAASHHVLFDLGAVTLRLENNTFKGAIPSEIGDMFNIGMYTLQFLPSLDRRLPLMLIPLLFPLVIVYLYLNKNSLSGTIPTELGRLTALGKCLFPCRSMHFSLTTHICWSFVKRSSLVWTKQPDGHDPFRAWTLSSARYVIQQSLF